jgi:hypothetical protein
MFNVAYLGLQADCSKTSDRAHLPHRISISQCFPNAEANDSNSLGASTCDQSVWCVLDQQFACRE